MGELAQQNRTSAHEYKRLYKLEESDPSSWQPLDPFRTFSHYAYTYGFGLKLSQRLRVVEGTEAYKLKNHRFRNFEQERKSWGSTVCGRNTEQECFGYVLYTHTQDGGSTEWRPAILETRDNSGELAGDSAAYKAGYSYFLPPLLFSESALERSNMDADVMKEEVSEDKVLFAPSVPRMLGSNNLQHQPFLALAPKLRADGLTDKEIAVELNAKMQAQFKNTKDGAVPPIITILEIRHYLRLAEISGTAEPVEKKVEPLQTQPSLLRP